MSVNTIVIFL